MPAPDDAKPRTRTPDAILIPKNYPPGVGGIQRLQELNRRFGPTLGAARVAVCGWMGGAPDQQFLRPVGFDPDATTQQFHRDSPHAGRERYEWFVAKEEADGTFAPVAPVLGLPGDANHVRLGYAIDEGKLTEDLLAEAADPEYEAALTRATADPAMRARMVRAGLLPGQAPAEVARAAVKAKAGKESS